MYDYQNISKNNIYCTNCGKIDHLYKNCKNPIISYGIMLFKYVNNTLYLLLVQRKDSIII